MSTSYSQKLEAEKRASTLQLLFKSARLLNELALARINRGRRGPKVRSAHTTLLPHLDLEGTRITELAARLGVSKQAVAQLVAELEEMGVVRRHPDPSDARAKLVRFTKKGREGLLHGLSVLQALEAELIEELGKHEVDQLNTTLARILALLER